MNAMQKAVGLALATVFASGSVYAQDSVATLRTLNGTVLVSQGDAMVAGATNQGLRVGTRVVTSAGANASIQYSNGCTVNLKENQRFVVRAAGECGALIAGIEGTGVGGAAGAGGAAAAGGGAAAGTGGLLAGGIALAAVGGVAIAASRDSNNASGN